MSMIQFCSVTLYHSAGQHVCDPVLFFFFVSVPSCWPVSVIQFCSVTVYHAAGQCVYDPVLFC